MGDFQVPDRRHVGDVIVQPIQNAKCGIAEGLAGQAQPIEGHRGVKDEFHSCTGFTAVHQLS